MYFENSSALYYDEDNSIYSLCKSMIRFVSVNKNYGGIRVLQNITFDIAPGECVAITGESGAGKTTLIKLLIGAISVSSGSIEIDTFHVETLSRSDLQHLRRNIGVVFQDFKLLTKKTVRENVAFALEVCDEPADLVEGKVMEALTIVGLEKKADRFSHELSGGECQRVAIARAIVHNPRMIIADEPTGNLDQKNSIEVISILKKINLKGVTIIVATHNLEVLDLLKPRIVRLENGQIATGAFDAQKKQSPVTNKIDLSHVSE